jgi:shikimate dehydrogenase
MGIPYAEVIGDPVSHSKSPLIHAFWLGKTGIEAAYRATQVKPRDLSHYLDGKRGDVHWRGCNVTAPLKGQAALSVGTPSGLCDFVGAVNCITRTPLGCLVGTNTDLAGIAEALAGAEIEGSEAVLIGAGGAARAALCHLIRHKAGLVTIVARDPAAARKLTMLIPPDSTTKMDFAGLEQCRFPAARARTIINATPMGMEGQAAMHPELLSAIGAHALVFDMVYHPARTALLVEAEFRGARTVDGFAMLIGQAAPAFELFFGSPAPREHDSELRELLKA